MSFKGASVVAQWIKPHLGHQHPVSECLRTTLVSDSDSASCQGTPWEVTDGGSSGVRVCLSGDLNGVQNS